VVRQNGLDFFLSIVILQLMFLYYSLAAYAKIMDNTIGFDRLVFYGVCEMGNGET
jgi:hypothetical protein